MKEVRVLLVRHGETNDNLAGIIQGQIDTPLNTHGLAQAEVTGLAMAQHNIIIHAAWSSDLSRASLTAKTILSKQKQPVDLQLDERIRERHLGKLQGFRRPKKYNDVEMGCELKPQLLSRLLEFWDALFPPLLSTPSIIPPSSVAVPVILLVSHGASMRTLVQSGLLQDRRFKCSAFSTHPPPRSIDFRNCSVTHIRLTDTGREGADRWKGDVLCLADALHLSELEFNRAVVVNADDVNGGSG